MKDKLQAYRVADTMGKSQLDLILMVYDGAVKALALAAKYYGDGDTRSGYEQMQSAKRMVTHLHTTLDVQKGGQVAQNLARMYAWIIGELISLEATKDLDRIAKVGDVLSNLRSAWAALKQKRSDRAGESTEDIAASVQIPDHVTVTA
ncbi:MAG: flagellar export chaperone FliS [Candidatus Zixiibacteriota bacterium]